MLHANIIRATYIQYGCGQSCPDGWVNFDASPTLRLQRLPLFGRIFQRDGVIFPKDVRFGDIVKGLPIADESVQGIYASHVLEHLSYSDFWIALNNTFRMLRPGGIFRLVVPDLEVRAQKYIEQFQLGHVEANSWFMRTTHLGLENRPRGVAALARNIFGHSAHLWMWDEQSIAAALRKTGFTGIRRCRLGDCEDKAFLLVEDAGRFYDKGAEVEECGMEARRSEAKSTG